MKLIQIALTNFRSVRERQVFKLPVGPGLFYLQGDNGAGKSTLWDAIYWCLFNKTSKGLTAGNVCNWGVSKGTVVELMTGEKSGTVITRTWGPNTWTLKNIFGVHLDLTKDETNPVLDMLRMGFTAFQQCCIMPQGRDMFLDLKPEAKATVFSEVLGLDRWLHASQRASAKAAELDNDMRHLESKVAGLQGQLRQASQVNYDQEFDTWELEHERTLDTLEALHREATKRRKDAVRVLECVRADAKMSQQLLDELLEATPEGKPCRLCGHLARDHDHDASLAEAKELARKDQDDERHALLALQTADRSLDMLEDDCAKEQARKNPWATRRSQARGQVQGLEEDLQAATRRLEALLERYTLASSWVRWFKDIRLSQIGDALAQLELEVNSALSDVGLLGWELRFDVDRETGKGSMQRGFYVTVLSPANSKPVPWEVWSGGEAQRLRIACQWGFADLARTHTGTEFPLEVWDEPTDGVQAEVVQELLEAMSRRAAERQRQIWVVDHTKVGFSGFDGVATATKGKNGTTWDTSALPV